MSNKCKNCQTPLPTYFSSDSKSSYCDDCIAAYIIGLAHTLGGISASTGLAFLLKWWFER